MSVPRAQYAARLPGTAHVPFTIVGTEIACFVRRHLTPAARCSLHKPGWRQDRCRACHEAINDGEGLVHQRRGPSSRVWGIPGPLAEAEADHVGWHQIARLVQRGCAQALAVRIVR